MHLRVLAQVSLNALLRFSSSSEYDAKIVRRMKDAKMQYPMAGEGIDFPRALSPRCRGNVLRAINSLQLFARKIIACGYRYVNVTRPGMWPNFVV
jgi:hypothetical protein